MMIMIVFMIMIVVILMLVVMIMMQCNHIIAQRLVGQAARREQ